MKPERLKRILEYSRKHREDIAEKVRNFYSCTGINNEGEVLNILQIVRPIFRKKDILFWRFPLKTERSEHYAIVETHWDIL